MNKPIIIVVDEDEERRGAFEGVLNNRFGHDYEVVPESSTDGCLATLERLARGDAAVALVIAAQRTPELADPEFFSRAHALYPGAKRLLTVPMVQAKPESVLPLITLGQIDDYFVTPWGHPEEKLYPQITELLSAWIQTVDRPTVEVVKVVGRSGPPGPTTCVTTSSAIMCRSGSTPTTPRRAAGYCGRRSWTVRGCR